MPNELAEQLDVLHTLLDQLPADRRVKWLLLINNLEGACGAAVAEGTYKVREKKFAKQADQLIHLLTTVVRGQTDVQPSKACALN